MQVLPQERTDRWRADDIVNLGDVDFVKNSDAVTEMIR